MLTAIRSNLTTVIPCVFATAHAYHSPHPLAEVLKPEYWRAMRTRFAIGDSMRFVTIDYEGKVPVVTAVADSIVVKVEEKSGDVHFQVLGAWIVDSQPGIEPQATVATLTVGMEGLPETDAVLQEAPEPDVASEPGATPPVAKSGSRGRVRSPGPPSTRKNRRGNRIVQPAAAEG